MSNSKILVGLLIVLFIVLIIYFISIPKILMIGYPNELVYQYNGPYIFDNIDIIGDKQINKLINFNDYDVLIFSIELNNIYKYGYDKKLKNFSGKIILITYNQDYKSKLSSISPKSKVYIFDHFLNSVELKNIIT